MTPRTFLASFDIEDWFHAENIRPSLGTSDWSALVPSKDAMKRDKMYDERRVLKKS